jgi:hypothetical protein
MSTYGSSPPRIAIFVDGWNFKYATYDAFGIQVDFIKLLNYLSQGSILIRAYYYTGEWTFESIDQYVKLASTDDPEALREDLRKPKAPLSVILQVPKPERLYGCTQTFEGVCWRHHKGRSGP